MQSQPVFFRRTYDEAFNLMIEARDYLRASDRIERERAGVVAALRLSAEAMRVTARLTQVMAWLMTQRAVMDGEITLEEALAEANLLSGTLACLDDSYAEDAALPGHLRRLLERSLSLYRRIARLEQQILRRSVH